jgi:hypothetical protein
VTFLGWLRLVLGFISLRAKVKKSQDSSNC